MAALGEPTRPSPRLAVPPTESPHLADGGLAVRPCRLHPDVFPSDWERGLQGQAP